MNSPKKLDPTGLWPDGELATATNFVRHFGHYAASSLNKPVYIAQHGRIGWALLSATEMTRLSGSDAEPNAQDARFEILLDGISTIVMLVDAEFRITRMNFACRRHFQIAEVSATPISLMALLQENKQSFIAEVCARVLNSGDTETFHLDSARFPGRTMHFQVMSFPAGLAILVDDITQATQTRMASSVAAATDAAMDAVMALGRGRVDIRGTISQVNGNLTALAETSAEKVMGLKLSALFEQQSRTRVRDSVDELLQSGQPFSIEAVMLNSSSKAVPVTVGAGAERDGGSITGAAFIVMPRHGLRV